MALSRSGAMFILRRMAEESVIDFYRGVSMRSSEPLQVVIGDVVRLRKPHPCGSYDWTVVRLGADIGLRCHGCGRRVLLPRRDLEKRLKTFLQRGPAFEAAEAALATFPDELSDESVGA